MPKYRVLRHEKWERKEEITIEAESSYEAIEKAKRTELSRYTVTLNEGLKENYVAYQLEVEHKQ